MLRGVIFNLSFLRHVDLEPLMREDGSISHIGGLNNIVYFHSPFRRSRGLGARNIIP